MSTGQPVRAYSPRGRPMKSRSVRMPIETWEWIAAKAAQYGHSEARVIATYLHVLQQAEQQETT